MSETASDFIFCSMLLCSVLDRQKQNVPWDLKKFNPALDHAHSRQRCYIHTYIHTYYIHTYIHKSFIKKMTERINLTIKDKVHQYTNGNNSKWLK